MRTARLISRLLMTFGLAVTLLPSAFAPAAPAYAADPADARDPDRRIEIVLKSVYVSDDHEWGTGQMQALLRLYRTNEGCSPGQFDPPSCQTQMASLSVGFLANDGDNVTLNRTMPATGPGASVVDPSIIGPEIGIPVWNDRAYRLAIRVDELDGGLYDELGVDYAVLSAGNNWFLGAHTARGMVYGEVGEPGDFSAEYEIRDARLPDLRPANITVKGAVDYGRHLVCVDMRNDGSLNAGLYELSIQVDGVTPSGGRSYASGLASGQAAEECVKIVLPKSGPHQLTVVVDEPRSIVEVSETNNRFTGPYMAARVGEAQDPLGQVPVGNADPSQADAGENVPSSPSGPVTLPAPGVSQPDLTVGAIKVNGRVPDGKDDCKDGKSNVSVVVKNVGTVKTGSFVVALAVDGDDAIEQSVSGLDDGKEREVTFEDVRLKKGEHKLVASVDGKSTVSESNEENNSREVAVQCKDAR